MSLPNLQLGRDIGKKSQIVGHFTESDNTSQNCPDHEQFQINGKERQVVGPILDWMSDQKTGLHKAEDKIWILSVDLKIVVHLDEFLDLVRVLCLDKKKK